MGLKIPARFHNFNQFLSDLQSEIARLVIHRIETQLEADVTAWLHRAHHEKRFQVKRQTEAYCQGCGTHKATAFSRNGHRRRQLVTSFGVLTFWLPRVVCECGGSVHIPFSIVQPYQRIWDDVLEQIGRWADLGLSLRQMQGEIGTQIDTQVGLRKLNEVVQDVELPAPLQLTSVPPVIMLDAIWVTLLQDTGTTRKDAANRHRPVKEKHKVCVLVALGLYPQSGRWGILGWHVADAESQIAWEALLLPLENRGLYRERGLELFIHDGGKGLIAALNLMYPAIPHQRCAFHKLRNLWHSIQTPKHLSKEQKTSFKQEIIQQVQSIFFASDKLDAKRLRDDICIQWQSSQPEFVATLLRDWDDTIAFFRVLDRFPKWRRTALRTTSLLERVNRMIRRLFRSAGAFHSLAGLLASLAHVLCPKWII